MPPASMMMPPPYGIVPPPFMNPQGMIPPGMVPGMAGMPLVMVTPPISPLDPPQPSATASQTNSIPHSSACPLTPHIARPNTPTSALAPPVSLPNSKGVVTGLPLIEFAQQWQQQQQQSMMCWWPNSMAMAAPGVMPTHSTQVSTSGPKSCK
jgi:hypothetical protein